MSLFGDVKEHTIIRLLRELAAAAVVGDCRILYLVVDLFVVCSYYEVHDQAQSVRRGESLSTVTCQVTDSSEPSQSNTG